VGVAFTIVVLFTAVDDGAEEDDDGAEDDDDAIVE
jgi:hypothetical protein